MFFPVPWKIASPGVFSSTHFTNETFLIVRGGFFMELHVDWESLWVFERFSADTAINMTPACYPFWGGLTLLLMLLELFFIPHHWMLANVAKTSRNLWKLVQFLDVCVVSTEFSKRPSTSSKRTNKDFILTVVASKCSSAEIFLWKRMNQYCSLDHKSKSYSLACKSNSQTHISL